MVLGLQSFFLIHGVACKPPKLDCFRIVRDVLIGVFVGVRIGQGDLITEGLPLLSESDVPFVGSVSGGSEAGELVLVECHGGYEITNNDYEIVLEI